MTASASEKTLKARRLLHAGALYDLVVVGPLALPVVALWHLEVLFHINSMLGFTGAFPEFAPIHLVFVNLFGMVIIVWAAMRFLAPAPVLARGDMLLRLGVSAILAWYAADPAVHRIVLIFLTLEIAWGLADWRCLRLYDSGGYSRQSETA
ncbi:MAG TPA: hypothetical protein PKE65_07805 [Rhizobiaceae bacterium]|nr:hypothetical protein [Rhizobiaceae bacterium]